MGDGMKRAFAAARETRLKTYDVATSYGSMTVRAETASEARKIAKQRIAPGEVILGCKLNPAP